MNGCKRLAFALAVIIMTGADASSAYADTNIDAVKNEILASQEDSYTLRNDPLLVTLFLGKTPQVGVNPEQRSDEVTSREDVVLSAWKIKQAPQWAKLPKGKFTVNASAYTASADECDNDLGITASGLPVTKNLTLACPPEFPFGAKVMIEGVGVLRCEDRGGAIKGNHFDIYMETKNEAFAFGRKDLTAEVIFE